MAHKTVLITGASRGIGRAIAQIFAEAGWSVGICCKKSMAELSEVKKYIEATGSQCFDFIGDMGCYEDAQKFITEARKALGPIDCLVNNAGVSYIGLLSDMHAEEWNKIIQINLTSVFNCCKQVIPDMVARQSGSIINISSVWGNCGASCEVAYSASKGGMNAFTKALAKELAPSHITVNAIACGAIDTEMNHFLSKEERDQLIDEIPACRMGTPEEVGRLALQLAGKHSYLTGQIITLDGGWI
ncbi:SDR family oxidoreductase [Frisingicoccus caecimuris]|uniref:3-oxoacyl-[acyl-carrier protein] reductase n=1 Tax=Frisingicoccus caecimuris TaxID=1796636 RepID=A0A4R2LE05_9FIRM|nr:SDR family oxidoreductase [Frisingicoccus caecimuris]MCR1918932.1 SDR family oxidoreductase [Frisingicoccus caecimuris]TCO82852.1 3-oxoacyl-[acyl-carrier protein] reductase [Frisingicoccus caecimuris]